VSRLNRPVAVALKVSHRRRPQEMLIPNRDPRLCMLQKLSLSPCRR
jgi:hypothetical protein